MRQPPQVRRQPSLFSHVVEPLCTALTIAVLAFACAGCGPFVIELHPVTGDTFRFSPPPPPSPLYGPFAAGVSPKTRFDSLVASWRSRLEAGGIPGGAIAIVLDGHFRFAAGVGTREAGRDAPITATTRFRTASVSKMVVAATILSMTEHDGLALDRPLTDYVPSFRRGTGYDASAVTLAMLLTHTGGIPDSVYCPDGASLRRTIDAHATDPYWAPPGRLFDYSNADYALLAAVIEAKTKRPFEDIVTERIFRPAGMNNARYTADEADTDVAHGHIGSTMVWTHPTDCEGSRAAGGVIASVTDFARFAELLLAGGGAVLSSASVDAMTQGRAVIETAPLTKYGYGLIEGSHAGLRTVEHSGAGFGFSTLVRWVPERGFAVVAFVNGATEPTDIVDAVTSAFLGVAEGPSERVPAPSATWPDYVGRYEDATGALGSFTVFVQGASLWAEWPAGRPRVSTGGKGTFVRDGNGRVEYFVTRGGVARRLP